MKVINNIIKDLNKAKTVDVLDEQAVFNGGPPEYWEMLLTDGESIRIYVMRFQQGHRILFIRSNTNKTYVSDSPELIKLMSDEYKRIYNENVP